MAFTRFFVHINIMLAFTICLPAFSQAGERVKKSRASAFLFCQARDQNLKEECKQIFQSSYFIDDVALDICQNSIDVYSHKDLDCLKMILNKQYDSQISKCKLSNSFEAESCLQQMNHSAASEITSPIELLSSIRLQQQATADQTNNPQMDKEAALMAFNKSVLKMKSSTEYTDFEATCQKAQGQVFSQVAAFNQDFPGFSKYPCSYKEGVNATTGFYQPNTDAIQCQVSMTLTCYEN